MKAQVPWLKLQLPWLKLQLPAPLVTFVQSAGGDPQAVSEFGTQEFELESGWYPATHVETEHNPFGVLVLVVQAPAPFA